MVSGDKPEEVLNETPGQNAGGPCAPGTKGSDHPEPAGVPVAEAEAARQRAAENAFQRISELEARIEQLSAEAEQLNDKYLRALADLENFRRRAREEQSEAVRAAEAGLIRLFLPVLDNFERALEAATSARLQADAQSVADGIKLIHKQFSDILSKRGVKRIEAVGKTFDPHLHEAVGYRPAEDHPEGIVLEEVEKGYRMGKGVLRPSRVIVSVRPLQETEEEPA
jgi:molecular chaperone GrpE